MGLALWICAECRVDNIKMFLLLLSRACPKLRPFLLLVSLAGEETGVCGRLGGDTDK